MASVSLEAVGKSFGKVDVVENLNLTVEDGEFMVLLGPSGCGKTTILRMIAGLEEPSAGRIFIGTGDVTDIPPKDRDIAMVFQNYALYPHMTVYDNMAFGLKLRKMPRAEIERRVQEAAEMLGLKQLLKRRPRELSGGQRQRVALGRAIVREPQVFLMDEPLSNLDAKLRTQMRVELKELHQRLKATAIYVTHDQTEALTLGTRIIVMKDGVVQQIGSPEEIYHSPHNRFVATFVGTPPMNMLLGVLRRGTGGEVVFDLDGQTVTLPQDDAGRLAAWSDRRLLLGIRPEDLRPGRKEGLPALEAVVRVVEALGHETLFYLEVGSAQPLVVRAPGGTLASGQMSVTLDPGKWHWFDAEDGTRVAGSADGSK